MKHYAKDLYTLRRGETRSTLQSVAIRTMDEVAAILGITKQAVQQNERRAIYKIRQAMARYLK